MASAELRDTRRRIRSIRATQKITRAMEMIASSRIPKAVARVTASDPYTGKLEEVVRSVAAETGAKSHPLLERRSLRTVGLLVVSADRGLAGSYSSSIIRLAETRVAELRGQGLNARLYVVGKKANAYFRFLGEPVEEAFLGITDTPRYADASRIAVRMSEDFETGQVDAIEAFYTEYYTALSQIPTRVELLPLETPTGTVNTPVAYYTYEPSAGRILDRLLPKYLETMMYNILLEASVSEHSARRRAMKAATDNAEDLIKGLSVQANRARQAEITTEISEIVGGAEALAAIRAQEG